MIDKPYFATPEEIISRKESLISQDIFFAKKITYFNEYLLRKKEVQNQEPNLDERSGINSIKDFLRQSVEALNFNHDSATDDEKLTYAIIYRKAFEKIRLLTNNRNDNNQVKLVIDDLSTLIKDIRSKSNIPVDTLDFYILRMDAFEKAVNPDSKWVSKSIYVD